jgi:hypothetical protein
VAKQFRALRLVGGIYRALAWVVFGGGLLLAVLAIVLGLLQGRGAPSPWLSGMPLSGWVSNPLAGLLVGVGILIVALAKFVLAYAAAECIELALSIERNTRETAYYLRGEGDMPAPTRPIPWDEPLSPPSDS